MKFGDNLKKLRKSKNLSQEELADKVNVSRQSVSKWETGEAYPEMNNILQLCKIFNCEINSLVNDNMIDLDSLDEEVKMSVVKFKEDKQKKMKTMTKVVYVFARIAKICSIVGIVAMMLLMLLTPVVTTNVKSGENYVKVFDEKIEYERTNEYVKLKVDGEEETIESEDEVIALNKIIDYIEDHNMTKVTILIEVIFVSIEGILVLTYLAFKKLDKLFTNIHSGDTPFTMENVDYIKKISYLLIGVVVVKFIASILTNILIDDGLGFTIGISDVLYILILFSLSYVFEYGYYIQQDSNGKMYGDSDE